MPTPEEKINKRISSILAIQDNIDNLAFLKNELHIKVSRESFFDFHQLQSIQYKLNISDSIKNKKGQNLSEALSTLNDNLNNIIDEFSEALGEHVNKIYQSE